MADSFPGNKPSAKASHPVHSLFHIGKLRKIKMTEPSGFDPGRFPSEHLRCMDPRSASEFAQILCRIDPWLRLGYSAAGLCRYLSSDKPGFHAFALMTDGAPAACLAVRANWLRGPLLETLAVMPERQGKGLGGELVQWLADETQRLNQSNLWTLVSAFNESAQAFYRRHGFATVGELPGFIREEETEILLRLRIAG